MLQELATSEDLLLPRVCLFTDSDVFAGTESHILDLAGALRQLNVPVFIAAPSPGVLATRAEQQHLRVLPIPKRGFVDVSAIGILRRLLRDGQLDIIHAHNGRTALVAALAVRAARRGVAVATQHFLEPNHLRQTGFKRRLSRLAHEWVHRHTHAHIAISAAVRDAMLEGREFNPTKISVVLNGIPPINRLDLAPAAEMRAQLNIAPDAPLLVCMARLEQEKNIACLITAMAQVSEAYPQAQCLILGEGRLAAPLQQQVETLGLQNSVRLLGFRADARSVLAAADLFVLPSHAEPFGLAIVEAMALGIPVIATNAGGPREIVEHKKTGLVVRTDDAPELATAIGQLLDDAPRRQQMGQAGFERYATCFTSERMARNMLAVYRRIFYAQHHALSSAPGHESTGLSSQ